MSDMKKRYKTVMTDRWMTLYYAGDEDSIAGYLFNNEIAAKESMHRNADCIGIVPVKVPVIAERVEVKDEG
jgi:hypothetical protein